MFVLLWVLAGVFACAMNPPQPSDSNPTVEIVRPNHVYTATNESLRQVDFRNFQFHIFDKNGASTLSARLRNGKYDSKKSDRKWKMGDGYDWLRLDWVRFAGKNSEFAIVSLSWVTAGGSTSDFGVVQVLTLLESQPVVVQQILFNTRGCGTSADLDTRLLLLTVTGVHGWEHCCPKTLDVIKFRWTGTSFKRESYHSIPVPKTC